MKNMVTDIVIAGLGGSGGVLIRGGDCRRSNSLG